MKTFLTVILISVLFQALIIAQQDNRTYGPILENYYADWIQGSGNPYLWDSSHHIGGVCGDQIY